MINQVETALYIGVAGVFAILGISIYQDIKSTKGEARKKKYIEYASILTGCIVLTILLHTVWAAPIGRLSATIENYTQRNIYGRQGIIVAPAGDPEEVLKNWTGNLSGR